MADHHNAKDASKRVTYTHCMGHALHPENTGAMHFGDRYREKHRRIYAHLNTMVKPGGLWVVNVSNFIRAGAVVDVVAWTESALRDVGLAFIDRIDVPTPRMGFGANAKCRVQHESILIFRKSLMEKEDEGNGDEE